MHPVSASQQAGERERLEMENTCWSWNRKLPQLQMNPILQRAELYPSLIVQQDSYQPGRLLDSVRPPDARHSLQFLQGAGQSGR